MDGDEKAAHYAAIIDIMAQQCEVSANLCDHVKALSEAGIHHPGLQEMAKTLEGVAFGWSAGKGT
jgi:hypothetical protein